MTPSSPTESPSFPAGVFDALVTAGDLRGRRLLVVGCRTGTLAGALAERAGCRVWGVDPSEELLAVARANVPGVRFKQARAEQLPFKAGWFECVVLLKAPHPVDRRRAFAESGRVLGPGGRIAIELPDPTLLEDELVAAGFGTITRASHEWLIAHVP
jgi:ubiquinone/menaquinone biosynthesis C-methylase UbiE